MRTYLINILPDIARINTYLYLLLPIMFFYFLASSKRLIVCLVSMLIILQSMSPISYTPLFGIKGLQPIYFLWALTFFAFLFSRDQSDAGLQLRKYFSIPILLLMGVYLTAWLMTFTAGSDHSFYLAGFNRTQLFLGYFLNPIQILLTGWMVMLTTENPEDRVVIQKSIMISAIIYGSLITIFYLKTGPLSGGHEGIAAGRHNVAELMGIELNGLSAVCVFLYIACLTMKEHQSKLLSSFSTGAILTGILFTLSRMAWLATVILTVLMFPKFKWNVRIFILLAIMAFYWQFHTLIINRIYYGFEKETTYQEKKMDKISAGRISLWHDAWKNVKTNPLIGTGIQSGIVMSDGRLAYHPHNAYLRELLDMGILGMGIVLICMGSFIKMSWKKEGPLFYSIIALFLMGFFCLEFHPHKQNYLIWIYYGMALNENIKTSEAEEKNTSNDKIKHAVREK